MVNIADRIRDLQEIERTWRPDLPTARFLELMTLDDLKNVDKGMTNLIARTNLSTATPSVEGASKVLEAAQQIAKLIRDMTPVTLQDELLHQPVHPPLFVPVSMLGLTPCLSALTAAEA